MTSRKYSLDHMTKADWDLLAEYLRSVSIDERSARKVSGKFDIHPRDVREFARVMQIPMSKQEQVEYFLRTPAALGLTRKQIADKVGCHQSIVCRVISSLRYPKHDLSTGMVDYMKVLHIYESKKKVLCECTYCGTQRDILTNEIEFRPNAPWCKCPDALAHAKRKRKKMVETRRDPYGFAAVDTHIRARLAYEEWINSDSTLVACCKKFETCTESVRRYRKKMGLPHKHNKWIDCEQDT